MPNIPLVRLGKPRTATGARIMLRAELERIAAFLAEAHRPEILSQHFGDSARSCSYCRALADARRLLRWTEPKKTYRCRGTQ